MKKERFVLVSYDIGDNKARTEVSNICSYYGLIRVQYSVFKGYIMDNDKKILISKLRSIERNETDSIQIIDLCESCTKNQIEIGTMPGQEQHLIL